MQVKNLAFIGHPNYEIDEAGNLFSLKYRKKEMRQMLSPKLNNSNKYVRYNLGRNNTMLAHRLVALAFIPNPKNKPEINHIDGNPQNNHISNLEWVTRSENNLHAYRVNKRKHIPYKTIKVLQIDCKTNQVINSFNSITEAHANTGVDSSCISKVVLNRPRYKTAGGFIWAAKQ